MVEDADTLDNFPEIPLVALSVDVDLSKRGILVHVYVTLSPVPIHLCVCSRCLYLSLGPHDGAPTAM